MEIFALVFQNLLIYFRALYANFNPMVKQIVFPMPANISTDPVKDDCDHGCHVCAC